MCVFDWNTFWDIFIEITTAAGSIATAITVWFLLQQRKDAIKPTVLIEFNGDFIIKFDSSNTPYWSHIHEDFIQPFFNIINPGNGLAEDIKVIPVFGKQKFINYLISIDKDNNFTFDIKDSYYIISNNKKGSMTNFRFAIDEKFNASALIDLKTSENYKIQVPLSYSYIEIIRAFEFVVDEYKTSGYYISKDFPKLFYKIKYRDSLGNKYFTYYEVLFQRSFNVEINFRKISKSQLKREILY